MVAVSRDFQEKSLARVYTHPNFEFIRRRYDVAIIEVSKNHLLFSIALRLAKLTLIFYWLTARTVYPSQQSSPRTVSILRLSVATCRCISIASFLQTL